MLTEERLEQARQIAVIGPHKLAIANFLQVSRQTLYVWLARGEEARALREAGEPIPETELPFLELVDTLCQGQAHVDLGALGTLVDAARKGDTNAARWLLERRHPEIYGRRVIQVEGGETPLRLAVEVDEDALAEHVAGMIARLSGQPVIDVEPYDELEAET